MVNSCYWREANLTFQHLHISQNVFLILNVNEFQQDSCQCFTIYLKIFYLWRYLHQIRWIINHVWSSMGVTVETILYQTRWIYMNYLFCYLGHIYRPQRSCEKVMFSLASVILFTGEGCLLDTPLGRHPQGRHPLPKGSVYLGVSAQGGVFPWGVCLGECLSRGKVMFSQASVILSTGGGCLTDTPLSGRHPQDRHPLSGRHPLLWTEWQMLWKHYLAPGKTPPRQTPPGKTPPWADTPR